MKHKIRIYFINPTTKHWIHTYTYTHTHTHTHSEWIMANQIKIIHFDLTWWNMSWYVNLPTIITRTRVFTSMSPVTVVGVARYHRGRGGMAQVQKRGLGTTQLMWGETSNTRRPRNCKDKNGKCTWSVSHTSKELWEKIMITHKLLNTHYHRNWHRPHQTVHVFTRLHTLVHNGSCTLCSVIWYGRRTVLVYTVLGIFALSS